MSKFPRFKPKEEFTKIPFDPNIRLRLPEFTIDEQYPYMYGELPQDDAQSQYVGVHFEGTTYHLFNA